MIPSVRAELVEALTGQGAAIGELSAVIATSFSGAVRPSDGFRLSGMGAIGTLRTMARADALDVVPVHVSQVAPSIAAVNDQVPALRSSR